MENAVVTVSNSQSVEDICREKMRFVYNECLTRLKDPMDAARCAQNVLSDFILSKCKEEALPVLIETACRAAVSAGAAPSDVRRDIDVPPGIADEIVGAVKHNVFGKKIEDSAQLHKYLPPQREKKKSKVTLPLLLILAAAAVVALTVTIARRQGAKEGPREDIEITEDYLEVASADEVYGLIGIKLTPPDGAKNVKYIIIEGEIAEVDLEYLGHQFQLRASKRGQELIPLDAEEAWKETVDNSTGAVLTTYLTDYERIMRLKWTENELNFVIVNRDGAEKDDEVKVYAAFKYEDKDIE